MIKTRKIICTIYALICVVAIILGYYRGELQIDTLTTLLGRIISAGELMIAFFLIYNQKNNKLKTPIKSIYLRNAFFFFWLISNLIYFSKTATLNLNVGFIVLILTLLSVRVSDKTLKSLIMLTALYNFLICILSLFFMKFGMGYSVDQEYFKVSDIGIRLQGLTQHANTLGAIALLVIIYALIENKGIIRVVGACIGGFTLYYTQSKTNIYIVLIIFIALMTDKLFKWSKRISSKKLTVSFVVVVLGIVLLANFGVIAIDTTFTGRSAVWIKAYQQWKISPASILFGIQSEIYLENMYLDALFRYGIVGLVSFVYLLFIMGNIAWSGIKAGHKTSFYLYIVVLLRCMTESIFINTNMGFGDFFTLVILISIEGIYERGRLNSNENCIINADNAIRTSTII